MTNAKATPRSDLGPMAGGRSIIYRRVQLADDSVVLARMDIFRMVTEGPEGLTYLAYDLPDPRNANRGDILFVTDMGDYAVRQPLRDRQTQLPITGRHPALLEGYHLTVAHLQGYAQELLALGLVHGFEEAIERALANAIKAHLILWTDVCEDILWHLDPANASSASAASALTLALPEGFAAAIRKLATQRITGNTILDPYIAGLHAMVLALIKTR